MAELLQQVVNGLALGTSYALIALAYTLVFGVLKVFNVAHGDVVMIGAYTGLVVGRLTHGNFLLALLGAVVTTGLAGLLLERLAVRPVRGSQLGPFLTTLGASIFIQSALRLTFSAQTLPYPVHIGAGTLHLGGVLIGQVQLIAIAIAAVLLLVLDFLVFRTRLGRWMRATAEDSAMASSLGINTDWIRVGTMVVSSALGGVTGVLLGTIYSAVSPLQGLVLGLKGLIVLVVGGLGSIRGAMAVGILLGLAEVLISAYISSSLRDVVAFGLLVVVLLMRPSGLFGERRRPTTAPGA